MLNCETQLSFMKKILLCTLAVIFSASSYAGYSLQFCTAVDKANNCKGKADVFEWTGTTTALQLLVSNKDKIKGNKLKLVLYEMSNDHDGTLYADLTLYVVPNSSFAFKKMYFYKPGYYKVEVRDESNHILTDAFVTITDRPN